jgi:Mono-functional DNA-alkylating methyl methanesulfonate N-term
VEARKPAEFVGVIPNWSPAIDFVATSRNQARTYASPDFSHRIKKRLDLDEPDKVFACTGRGSHGAVSEMRYGHEARIRLEVGPLDVPITETWVLPSGLSSSDGIGTGLPSPLLFLLTIVDQSSLLHLSADSKVIEEVEQSRTWLDLSSRTLVATAYNGLIVQITERSISISREPVL